MTTTCCSGSPIFTQLGKRWGSPSTCLWPTCSCQVILEHWEIITVNSWWLCRVVVIVGGNWGLSNRQSTSHCLLEKNALENTANWLCRLAVNTRCPPVSISYESSRIVFIPFQVPVLDTPPLLITLGPMEIRTFLLQVSRNEHQYE
jgi:hypothetical protein